MSNIEQVSNETTQVEEKQVEQVVNSADTIEIAMPREHDDDEQEQLVVVVMQKDGAEKAVDMIINAAETLNKFIRCNPCQKYVLQQLAFEQKAADQEKNFDVTVYKTFFMDD
eukprot:CAMPEP_0119004106 /NCGR_PEP_ID=MMETSP1176-20130426/957_1 /TAXON_ID=265551 /ORGANISM="Synedropsis recta cf, Strain CCMP1620" /LENGTH=111 /DNA_ID=CAMNT_0006955779 /DNA_START=40 /DNA_END=375 /DNA_ORIENTATION=+